MPSNCKPGTLREESRQFGRRPLQTLSLNRADQQSFHKSQEDVVNAMYAAWKENHLSTATSGEALN